MIDQALQHALAPGEKLPWLMNLTGILQIQNDQIHFFGGERCSTAGTAEIALTDGVIPLVVGLDTSFH